LSHKRRAAKWRLLNYALVFWTLCRQLRRTDFIRLGRIDQDASSSFIVVVVVVVVVVVDTL